MSETISPKITVPGKNTHALQTAARLTKYVLSRISMIFATIVIGVFITVVLANQGGTVDGAVRRNVIIEMNKRLNFYVITDADRARVDEIRLEMQEASGLNLPYWPRHIRWTFDALTMRLGSEEAILESLPNTILLIGSAFLLLFSLGIPLALFLFRKQGKWADRFVTILAPLSSIPSWVLAILLVLLFAVQLRLLPMGGKYDMFPPDSRWGYIWVVLKHMIIPVSAIFLSIFFQAVYTWRTFFLLYADEDYVELGKAKGLSNRLLEKRYVLKPTLTYILTNFAMMLAGFWQVTTALEAVMGWPGLGSLYINSLPNYKGELFYPGEMAITVGIVVMFAYLLGSIVLLLDISYAILDPRIRIEGHGKTVQHKKTRSRPLFQSWRLFGGKATPAHTPATHASFTPDKQIKKPINFKAGFRAIIKGFGVVRPVLKEIKRYPSAIFGLVVISLLIFGSILAVTIFPYNQMGEFWYTKTLSGRVQAPKYAQPAWVNYFRKDPLPISFLMDNRTSTASKSITPGSNGFDKVTLTYFLDYDYDTYPNDFYIYFDPTYVTKSPFVFITWITPDGRQIDLGGFSANKGRYLNLAQDTPTRRLLAHNNHWKSWFGTNESNFYSETGYHLLFSPENADQAAVEMGRYELRLEALTFEQGSSLDAEVVVLGGVYGIAGTDHMRRNLLVPLLWGMPFALAFGLLGALVTTILSMTLAAVGAWYGGWLDNLIQRLIEANMILPIVAVGILLYAYFNVSIWTLLTIVVLLNVFGSPTKSFRAALLQVRESPYVEAAKAYGASNWRIIFHYLVPRILPVLIPQLVTLIPSYVFLEATLGIFNIRSDYPTWGKVIYEAIMNGGTLSARYWVLEPIALLLLTGLAFAMLGFALERILNPKLRTV